MSKLWPAISRLALPSLIAFAAAPSATLTGDLSKYRDFQLGSDLPTVAKQIGASSSEARTIHRRPALVQELAWRPQPLGPSSKAESAQEVIFSFYNGELFRIAVNYDHYQTEGLTNADMVDAISANFGMATKPAVQAKAAPDPYDNQDETLAQWQDAQYRFDLIRSSYGPSFKLVGVLKRLESSAQAAALEAARLEEQEAPQREAEKAASEAEIERANLEKARLVNRPKFRP